MLRKPTPQERASKKESNSKAKVRRKTCSKNPTLVLQHPT